MRSDTTAEKYYEAEGILLVLVDEQRERKEKTTRKAAKHCTTPQFYYEEKCTILHYIFSDEFLCLPSADERRSPKTQTYEQRREKEIKIIYHNSTDHPAAHEQI